MRRFPEDGSMKLVATLLGVVLLVIAAVYFLLPAAGLFTRVRGLAAGAWIGEVKR
jgi:hypothetical protein